MLFGRRDESGFGPVVDRSTAQGAYDGKLTTTMGHHSGEDFVPCDKVSNFAFSGYQVPINLSFGAEQFPIKRNCLAGLHSDHLIGSYLGNRSRHPTVSSVYLDLVLKWRYRFENAR